MVFQEQQSFGKMIFFIRSKPFECNRGINNYHFAPSLISLTVLTVSISCKELLFPKACFLIVLKISSGDFSVCAFVILARIIEARLFLVLSASSLSRI